MIHIIYPSRPACIQHYAADWRDNPVQYNNILHSCRNWGRIPIYQENIKIRVSNQLLSPYSATHVLNEETTNMFPASVTSTGNVTWSVTTSFENSCTLNMYTFPFDRQHCALEFGNLVHNWWDVDLTSDSSRVCTRDMFENKEFTWVLPIMTSWHGCKNYAGDKNSFWKSFYQNDCRRIWICHGIWSKASTRIDFTFYIV